MNDKNIDSQSERAWAFKAADDKTAAHGHKKPNIIVLGVN